MSHRHDAAAPSAPQGTVRASWTPAYKQAHKQIHQYTHTHMHTKAKQTRKKKRTQAGCRVARERSINTFSGSRCSFFPRFASPPLPPSPLKKQNKTHTHTHTHTHNFLALVCLFVCLTDHVDLKPLRVERNLLALLRDVIADEQQLHLTVDQRCASQPHVPHPDHQVLLPVPACNHRKFAVVGEQPSKLHVCWG